MRFVVLRRPLFATGFLALALAASCTKSDPPRVQLADVERCERGVQAAMQQPALEEALATYYRECADVYKEPGCKAAFLAASTAPHEKQLDIIADGCRKSYCPTFADRGLELCQGGNPSNTAALERGWGHLHEAILEHDAKALAPRVSRTMVGFYAFAQKKALDAKAAAEAPPPPSAAPATSGAPPGPASALSAASAPPASASAPPAVAAPPKPAPSPGK